ncbi:MAG: AraC family transcriptional regulator [Mycobacterium sp.]
MAGRTVAIQFVRTAMDSARAHGIDVEEILREARITHELIERDATRVTRAQATRVVQALWDATDDELFGVGPHAVPRGTFRMMTLGVIHTPDLRSALGRLIEFITIAMRFEAVDMLDDGGSARFSFDPGGRAHTDGLLVDVVMAVAHRFAGWLIGQRIELDSVELPGAAPPHAAEYMLIYGVAPTFQAPRAAMSFASRYLRAPVVRSEDALTEFIRRSPNDLLFRQDYHPTTSSRVRKIIERGSHDEGVTVDDVAARLTVSAQHVRRLLREEGTSFREIKEEILRDEAIAALVRGGETVEQLSERLGFSEPSAFRRAFRRWTGSPPGSYRPMDEDAGGE